MFPWRKTVAALALTVLPAAGATVTIEQILKANAGAVFPATSVPGVPGRPPQFVFRGDAIPPPAINDAGEIVFRARSALNTNTNCQTAFGLYAKRPGFPLAVLVDTTEVGGTCFTFSGVPTYAVPGRPANNQFLSFKLPIMNNAGDVVFQATFSSPGTTPGSGTGVYATKVTGGPIVKISDTFTPVPNYPTSVFNTFDPGFLTVTFTTGLNDVGQVAYWGQFLIPGNTTQRNGFFGSTVAGGAGVRLADSVGASGPVSVPVGANDFFREIRPVSAINNFGTVAFSGGMPGGIVLRGGIYVVPVTGGPITTVAIQSQPVPNRPGDFYSGSFEPGGHSVDINDSGVILFQNLYRAFSSPQDSGLYAATPSPGGYVHTRIYDTQGGIPIPTEPPGTFEPAAAQFNGVQTPGINENGVVAPFSFIFPGSPTPNQQGIYYTDTDGTPMSVVANLLTPPPGQPAPVGGFPKFSGLAQSNGGRAAINDLGNAAFVAVGNVSVSVGFRGLYFYDVCTPELVRISDSTISTAQLGGFVVNGYDIYQAEATTGMYRSINNLNDLAFAAQFNNFDYGLYIAHVTTGAGGQLQITCPSNVTAACPANTDPSATGTATATGCGTITVSHSDVTTAGCGGTASITRTWSAGNGSTTASCVQTFTETDTTAPVLSGVPDKTTVQCNAMPLPPPANVTADDACNGSTPVTLTVTQTPGPCPGTFVETRTWTATDGCANNVSASQDICVFDTVDPTLMNVPADVSVECDAVPAVPVVTGADTCDTSVPVSFTQTQTNGTCPDEYTLTRSWTAVDDCANDVTASQFITVDDTTPPTITCPAHATWECPADTSVAANGSASAQDNCGTPTVSSSDATQFGCGGALTVTRSWSASDECGNPAACEQFVAVVDTTAPILTVDTTPITVIDVDCSGGEVVALPAGSANDACDGPIPVTHDALPSFPAGNTTTVTYTAADGCGNSASATKDVTVRFGATVEIRAERHTIGTGSHPASVKDPLVGINVCIYDKTNAGCAMTTCGGISHHQYQCILDTCTPVNCELTGSDGIALIDVAPGNYVVISGDATKTVLPDPLGVSVGEVHCGQIHKKYLQQIVRVDGSRVPGKTTRLTGSELLIIEPEYVVWDNTVQLYPFVFETIGDWSVVATVAPPEGFVADYQALSAEVDNELKSVQFTITELGSDLVPTQTEFRVVHNNRTRTVRSKVDILVTPEYARARGFNVDSLKMQGLIAEPAREHPNDKGFSRPSGR